MPVGRAFCIQNTNNPEHNIACDIYAAQKVFSSETPKTIIPLDVTCKTAISREDFNCLGNGNELDQSIKRLVNSWFNYRDNIFRERIETTCMHDPLTLAVISNPRLIRTARVLIYVNNNGLTKAGHGSEVNLATSVDSERFREHFLKIISKKD